jgi:hypothetical protein
MSNRRTLMATMSRYKWCGDVLLLLSALAVITALGVRLINTQRILQGRTGEHGLSVTPNRAAIGVGAGEGAVVLVTSSDCHFCRDSLPFYRELVPRARTNGVRVVGVTREAPELNEAYLGANGVVVDAVLSGVDIGLPAYGTPTLVLVPKVGSGKVWVGRLSKKEEQDVEGYLQFVIASQKH